MRLSSFILFNVALTIVFFCVGYQNLLSASIFQTFAGTMGMTVPANGTLANVTMQQPKSLEINDLVQDFAKSLVSSINIETALGIIGIGLGAFFVANYLSGFSANFIVPAIIIMLIMNFLFFPISLITDASLPIFLKFFVFILYNTFTIIATIDFIRGGM